MGVPTQIILEGANVLIKDASNNILKILMSAQTFAHPSNVDIEFTNEGTTQNVIYLNNSPSNRETFGERFYLDVTQITEPAPPLGGWTVQLMLQELSDNYLGKAAPATVDNTAIELLLTQIKDCLCPPTDNDCGCNNGYSQTILLS